MNKCVFLDRDGVLNQEIGNYVYRPEALIIPAGVPKALKLLKDAAYKLVVVTNQAGIAQGLYTRREVLLIYGLIQDACNGALDALYFSPYHPRYDSESLSRKPGSLMLEKATARFGIDPARSWMVGDRRRDLEAARRLGVRGIFIRNDQEPAPADTAYVANDLLDAAGYILGQS
jgi:D-glycero-D-manno-heptose 1,7-bisphosphate phosphatase